MIIYSRSREIGISIRRTAAVCGTLACASVLRTMLRVSYDFLHFTARYRVCKLRPKPMKCEDQGFKPIHTTLLFFSHYAPWWKNLYFPEIGPELLLQYFLTACSDETSSRGKDILKQENSWRGPRGLLRLDKQWKGVKITNVFLPQQQKLPLGSNWMK